MLWSSAYFYEAVCASERSSATEDALKAAWKVSDRFIGKLMMIHILLLEQIFVYVQRIFERLKPMCWIAATRHIESACATVGRAETVGRSSWRAAGWTGGDWTGDRQTDGRSGERSQGEEGYQICSVW